MTLGCVFNIVSVSTNHPTENKTVANKDAGEESKNQITWRLPSTLRMRVWKKRGLGAHVA